MARITLRQAAQWCGGCVEEKYQDISFCGANIDSRKLQPGELFVAILAARDGHDFIPAALEKGAAAVLCTRLTGDYPAIVVEDTRLALGKIASGLLRQMQAKVIGVTGSVGKSTTKEMVASVLQTTYRVSKTPANHNNDLGMPAAVLAMEENTQVAVLEMGMSHFGEIAYLSEMAKPDLGVIINVGTMHIENLGSREGILQAKLEITRGMGENGKLFLYGDNSYLWGARENLPVEAVYFGSENTKNHILAKDICQTPEGLCFRVEWAQGAFDVCLPLEGMHYVSDALAAISVALELQVDVENIRRGLAGFQTMEGRQEILDINGYTVIKDCYNAGPESMAAALSVLGNRRGRRIAVLADMLELGCQSAQAHIQVGKLAAQKADVLLCYGPESAGIAQGARAEGMTQVYHFLQREQLVCQLSQIARPSDVILFKGSRGMRVELAMEAFLQKD